MREEYLYAYSLILATLALISLVYSGKKRCILCIVGAYYSVWMLIAQKWGEEWFYYASALFMLFMGYKTYRAYKHYKTSPSQNEDSYEDSFLKGIDKEEHL